MYIIDKKIFLKCMNDKGVSSISELANILNIHRNSIHSFLSGKSVFPKTLEKVFSFLEVDLGKLILKENSNDDDCLADIFKIIDKISEKFPAYTFVLFGSRAKKKNKKYSDIDIGVYSRKGISHIEFLKILHFTKDIEEGIPYFIDLANFNNADSDFLINISNSLTFLAGKRFDFMKLMEEVLNAKLRKAS